MPPLNSQEMMDSQTGFEDTCSRSADSPFIVCFIVVIDRILWWIGLTKMQPGVVVDRGA